MHTLIIDDDPFALRLLSRQLEQLGYADVTLCEHAQDALALLEVHFNTISLVFCDLQMPDIDGIEFIRHLARMNYRGDLVLVSGEDRRVLQTAQKLVQAHQINMLGILSKPVSTEELRLILDRRESHPTNAAHRVARQAYGLDELQRAIANTELVNYYQPKVEIATGALVGVEALVRWQHPRDGLLMPDQFISMAEEQGLINDLTLTVLKAALRQLRLWQDAGLVLEMAINVSMENLAVLDFPDTVARLAGEAGVELSSLMLEVTESRLMQDSRGPLDTLSRLRLKRIGLAIDDFGTGHSSLAQLRDIPFDELKLDRSFIHGAFRDPALRTIVNSTLTMVRQLGIKSVAEGVEERADWDFIRALGCDVAQGYFIARPMPAIDLPRWRDDWELRCRDLIVPRPWAAQ